jgi:hypothetical protein
MASVLLRIGTSDGFLLESTVISIWVPYRVGNDE